MQASTYKFPSEKDMKHINRKLRSCWGLSSNDEYIVTTLLIFYNPELVFKLTAISNAILLTIAIVCSGKKRERKSKHKSKHEGSESKNG